MRRPNPAHRRGGVLALATLSAAALVLTSGGPALADTKPASPPTTVSTDRLATAQMNGVAWTQVVVGNTVYVGGHFSKARPAGAAAGTSETGRNNMLAYDITTGALKSFNPNFNSDVRALAVSPDQSTIYAVGSFTTAGGQSHSRIAAISVSTGAVKSTFKASLNSTAYGVAATNSRIYVGGAFTSASGATRNRAAGFSSTGALLSWAPSTDLPVRALVVSPDGASVVLGGNFTKVNGATIRGSARVDSGTGKSNQTWSVNSVVQNSGLDASTGYSSAIWSLTTDGSVVYATGMSFKSSQPGNKLEGAYAATWPSGSIKWIEDCHGDSYSSSVANGALYIAGHPHDCGNVPGGWDQSKTASPQRYQRGIAFSLGVAGTLKAEACTADSCYSNYGGRPAPALQVWFPDFNTGTTTGQNQGPWSVASNSQYVVYAGEFTTVNNQAQQGLVRFAVPSIAPNKDGPRLTGSGFLPKLTAVGGGKVQVSFPANFDRDNESLTYQITRDGVVKYTTTVKSRIWYQRPTITWTDSGLAVGSSHGYRLRATDPYGNYQLGSTVSVTVK
jgi:hypothetical protein